MLLARERSCKDATLTQGRTALAGEIFLKEALKIGRDYAVKYRIAFRRRSCAAPMRYTCRLLEIPPRRRNRGANPRELERFSSRRQEKRKKNRQERKKIKETSARFISPSSPGRIFAASSRQLLRALSSGLLSRM